MGILLSGCASPDGIPQSAFDPHADSLQKLDKFTTSMGCLYIKGLDDVDKQVLKELVQASVKRLKQVNK